MPSLYLIRHGIAEDRGNYEDDTQRPLTEEGRKKTKQVAKRLYELGLRFDLLQTSPLVRAQQTSEIFANVFSDCPVQQLSELAPNGSFEDWLKRVAAWLAQHPQPARASLGIIGHEPDLTTWAEMLVWGESKGVLVLKKAGIIGLVLPETQPWTSNGILFLSIPPKLLI
ncbi:phosphohistidine phosphatase SixA [Pseudanabaena sp. lw0831]|uniref:phosphohistidine phosphatase SixA n=1 Tax=Pseudanabaena sp. lw0831 TaxID=1357935 RepID=UPI001916C623|nr:phosphohistidine phosphatase SixA [Pseudanabaena sp. lw0831]GBO56590.1 phosphohistidine phosphatase SixA [Pseudanabaena sp. lw0831]